MESEKAVFDLTAAAVHGADQGVKDPNSECTSLLKKVKMF